MAKQDVTFNQSSWSNEEQATTKKVDVKGILGRLFGWLLRAVLFVIATPFYIVIWTINFIKSLFGMFIMWVVGKCCLSLFVFMFSWLLNAIKLIDEVTADRWSGSLGNFLFDSTGDTFERLFPYGELEYWAIFILALIIATFSTIYRDEL